MRNYFFIRLIDEKRKRSAQNSLKKGGRSMDNGARNYRRFLDGYDSGIVEIVEEYKDPLILYLNNYVNNIHTAEELAEDSFFKLMVKKPRFSGKSSFKTWLYAIGRNVAMDHVRRTSKLADELTEDVIAAEEDLERSYLREEQKIILHRRLAELKPEYREVLYLTYFEEQTNDQAAKIMKKSKRQIEMLVYRAKQSLRNQLEKDGFVYEEF